MTTGMMPATIAEPRMEAAVTASARRPGRGARGPSGDNAAFAAMVGESPSSQPGPLSGARYGRRDRAGAAPVADDAGDGPGGSGVDGAITPLMALVPLPLHAPGHDARLPGGAASALAEAALVAAEGTAIAPPAPQADNAAGTMPEPTAAPAGTGTQGTPRRPLAAGGHVALDGDAMAAQLATPAAPPAAPATPPANGAVAPGAVVHPGAVGGLMARPALVMRAGRDSTRPESTGQNTGLASSGTPVVRFTAEAGQAAAPNVPFSFQSELPGGGDREPASAQADSAAPSDAAEGTPPAGSESFADIAIGQGTDSGLSVRLAAMDADAMQRLERQVGTLEQALRETGSDVEAIRVELRGAPGEDARDGTEGAWPEDGPMRQPGNEAGMADRRDQDGSAWRAGESDRDRPAGDGRSLRGEEARRDSPERSGAAGRALGTMDGKVDRYG